MNISQVKLRNEKFDDDDDDDDDNNNDNDDNNNNDNNNSYNNNNNNNNNNVLPLIFSFRLIVQHFVIAYMFILLCKIQ